ncbi:CPG4 domain containing protein [Trichuris trichiura]|uniref:CPG4 domain containing protein n=1 Tax=Trichuris trichiura TaxID=36087 RepID=A0A077ZC02_TRITR|nr:CPG4 domain containing protein [Trichuris trichiura]
MSFSKLFFIGLVIVFVEAYRCPQEAVARIDFCIGPVERSIDAMISSELFQHDREPHQYTLYDNKVNTFQELCREIWSFETCIRPVEYLCSEHKTLKFIQESYGYLCTEEYADFLSYVDCIVRVENGKDDCVKKATRETITYRNGTNSQSSNEAACRYFLLHNQLSLQLMLLRLLNGFLSCLQPSIEAMCGNRAWNLVEKFFEGARRILLADCKRREDKKWTQSDLGQMPYQCCLQNTD